MSTTKSIQVLDIHSVGDHRVSFNTPEWEAEDSGYDVSPTIFNISKDAWADLGSPQEVTVTVVPGNQLSEELTQVDTIGGKKIKD